MRMLIATAGVLSPEPVARVAERLGGDGGDVVVITVIQVPRSFLEAIRSEHWHPLADGTPEWTSEEDAMIARHVEERGQRITEPMLSALRVHGIEPRVRYLEGEDPAGRILAAADEIDADLIVVGATKQLFEEWESVSARVLRDTIRPVLVVPNPPRADTVDDEDE